MTAEACKETWTSSVIGRIHGSLDLMWLNAGVMHYGNQDRNFTYSMSEENTRRNLDTLEEEKHLGVKFYPTLCFTKHVAMVSSKANRMVGIIRKTFDFMDEKLVLKTLCILYKTLVRPHLEYANCIWNPPTKQGRANDRESSKTCHPASF